MRSKEFQKQRKTREAFIYVILYKGERELHQLTPLSPQISKKKNLQWSINKPTPQHLEKADRLGSGGMAYKRTTGYLEGTK